MPHKDPEIRKAYLKKWQKEHPEKMKEYREKSYNRDPEKAKKRIRRYYDSEKGKNKIKEYYDGHREERNEARRQFRQNNRELMNKRQREYVRKNKRKLNSRRNELYRDRKIRIIQHYGGKCDCCGEAHLEFLTIDHIKGGGTAHRKKLKTEGGSGMYRWLEKNDFPEGFRILCWNCNCALGIFGYCPHTIKQINF